MRLLLFFISFLFSAIFYIFHSLSLWLNIFWEEIYNKIYFNSLSWNLLIESFVFFLIWMILTFYFSPLNWEKTLLINKNRVFYFLFYISLIALIYFGNFYLSRIIVSIIFIFIFWDICFNFLSNLNILKSQKNNLRYFWLILNYISTWVWLIYFYLNEFSIYIFLILIFNIFFNINVHKKYINYISLLFSIFISCFLMCFLFLKLYDFYIVWL